MTALTLYQIAAEHAEMAQQLADMDLDPQTLADTLEGDLAAFEDKARAVACVCANLQAEAEAYAAHIKAVQAKEKSAKARVEWLKLYLLNNMQAVGVTEIKGPAIKIKIANNPESVEVFEPATIPAEYLRTPPPPEAQPDKTAIKEAIKAGVEVPGARLTRTQRITIGL